MVSDSDAHRLRLVPGGHHEWLCPWCGRINKHYSYQERQFLHGVPRAELERRRKRDQIEGKHITFHGYHCTFCNRATITMADGTFEGLFDNEDMTMSASYDEHYVVYPLSGGFRPVPPEVPEPIAKAFREAASVLDFSPNATAVLCRRTLQLLLRRQPGVTPGKIRGEIKAVAGQVPDRIERAMDAIRDVSAAGAHPSVDVGEVVDFEWAEANVLLHALWEVMTHFYPPPQNDTLDRLEKLVSKKGQSVLGPNPAPAKAPGRRQGDDSQ